jgi:hypothetical protein
METTTKAAHAHLARRITDNLTKYGPLGFHYLQEAMWCERAHFEAVVRDLEARSMLTWVRGRLTLMAFPAPDDPGEQQR